MLLDSSLHATLTQATGAFLTVLGYLNTNILSPQAMPNTIIRRFSGRLVSTWRNMPAFLRRKQDNGTELGNLPR